MLKRTNITLVETNILAIHTDRMILETFNNDLETHHLFMFYLNFPISAEFFFSSEEKIDKIETTAKCGYVADIVIPNLHYCKNISKIRKLFEDVFIRDDGEAKKYLIEKLSLHDWAFWTEKGVYNTMHSARKIYCEDRWDDACECSKYFCIFDFKKNPSINFANFIKRMLVGLIYGFYKYGTSQYESYTLLPLETLYQEFYDDSDIKEEIKELVEKDLIAYVFK